MQVGIQVCIHESLHTLLVPLFLLLPACLVVCMTLHSLLPVLPMCVCIVSDGCQA